MKEHKNPPMSARTAYATLAAFGFAAIALLWGFIGWFGMPWRAFGPIAAFIGFLIASNMGYVCRSRETWIGPEACAACGYNLTGLGDEPTCPECGSDIGREKNPRAQLKARHMAIVAIAGPAIAATAAFSSGIESTWGKAVVGAVSGLVGAIVVGFLIDFIESRLSGDGK